jgi:hypothetical protein
MYCGLCVLVRALHLMGGGGVVQLCGSITRKVQCAPKATQGSSHPLVRHRTGTHHDGFDSRRFSSSPPLYTSLAHLLLGAMTSQIGTLSFPPLAILSSFFVGLAGLVFLDIMFFALRGDHGDSHYHHGSEDAGHKKNENE